MATVTFETYYTLCGVCLGKEIEEKVGGDGSDGGVGETLMMRVDSNDFQL